MSLTIQNFIPKFITESQPKIGLIALSTDHTIEKDFKNVCLNLPVNIFVNRIPFKNPMNKKNYLKMTSCIEEVTNNILPGEKIDTIAYGCTSGTIAIGEDKITEKIHLAKPKCYVTTPITATIKAINKLNIKKIAVFTPYPEIVNKTILNYFLQAGIEITNFGSYNLDSDLEVGKISSKLLIQTIKKMNIKNAEAIFVSCTALPILEVVDEIEKILPIPILSSNQVLIWDCLRSVYINDKIIGYGKLLNKF